MMLECIRNEKERRVLKHLAKVQKIDILPFNYADHIYWILYELNAQDF